MSTNNQNQTSSPSGADGIQMKDSGIFWIASIPIHWRIVKLKYLVFCLDGKRVPVDASLRVTGEYPYWGAGNIVDYVNQYLFDDELVLLGEDGAPFFDKTRPVAFYSNEKIWVNNHIHVLKARDSIDSKFLVYALNSVDYHEYIFGSILPKLTQLDMNSITLPLPDYPSQRYIASYLDTQCNLIDQQIAALKESIEKLEQVKISKVYQVITKGLDASVNYTDSGIPWIGQYPVSWDLRPLKSMFAINKRIAGTLGYDVLSITQKGIKIKDIISNEGQQSNDYSKYQIVKPGDFAMNHMDLLTGFVDLSEVEGVTSPDYRVFTPISKDIDPHYALYIFQTAYRAKIFYGLGQGVSTLGRWRLPKEQFLNFVIPVPSLDEQGKIVRHLDSFCSSVDGLIQSYTDKLDSLMNFKVSLIYECVTGKKSVSQEVDA